MILILLGIMIELVNSSFKVGFCGSIDIIFEGMGSFPFCPKAGTIVGTVRGVIRRLGSLKFLFCLATGSVLGGGGVWRSS